MDEKFVSSIHVATLRLLTEMIGKPVMENTYRGAYSEAQVGVLLGDGWSSAGADWGSYDFLYGATGTRLEVKSSAARQTWKQRGASVPTFDIAPRQGYYVDGAEVNEWRGHEGGAGRSADIYVFAWHPVYDESCDQRDECQWEYFVAAADRLPPAQKTIRLSMLRPLCSEANAGTLRSVVDGLLRRSPREESTLPAPEAEEPLQIPIAELHIVKSDAFAPDDSIGALSDRALSGDTAAMSSQGQFLYSSGRRLHLEGCHHYEGAPQRLATDEELRTLDPCIDCQNVADGGGTGTRSRTAAGPREPLKEDEFLCTTCFQKKRLSVRFADHLCIDCSNS